MLEFPGSRRILRIAPAAVAGLLWCAAAIAQVGTVYPANDPTDIVVAGDGTVWFADRSDAAIVRIDVGGTVTKFPTPETAPRTIALGPDGNLWFADLYNLFRMAISGVVTRINCGGGFEATPSALTVGPDRNLWYVDTGRSRLIRVTVEGTCTAFPVPGAAGKQWVLGTITAGPDGNVWFTEPGINRIGRITPSGSVTEFELPRADTQPNKIVAGPDGNLWFTESGSPPWIPRFGRITPAGAVTEFDLPEGATSITAGRDGNLWLGWSDSLIQATTNGTVTVFPVSVPGVWWVWPSVLVSAPDGAIWLAQGYDDWDGIPGSVMRFAFERSACVADPATLCLDGGRFRVTTDWKAADGSSGRGHAVNLSANSGYFWFFDPANLEVVAKVLDGCSANRSHWVFAAGLTNVETTTRVTDTWTGFSRNYANPQGTPFAPVQDTAAFATCP